MPKRLLMNNNSGEIILCKNYFPEEKPFYLLQDKMIDWDNYELYLNVDLSNHVKSGWSNILSIGGKITVWSEQAKFHVYYDGDRNTIRLQIVYGGSNVYREYTLSNTNEVTIVINKTGMYLNNELKVLSDLRVNEYFRTNPISIGSQEGKYKGIARYNLVSLRKYVERG